MRKISILLSLLLVLALCGPLFAAQNYVVVKGMVGQVNYKYPNGTYRALRNGQRLYKGVVVQTGVGSRVRLGFPNDSSEIVLKGRTTMRVDSLLTRAGKYKTSLFLPTGRLKAVVSAIFGRNFSVRTKTAVAGVRGTVLAVDSGAGNRESFFCFEGKIAVQGRSGGPQVLSAGQKLSVLPTGLLSRIRRVTRGDARRFEVAYQPPKRDPDKKDPDKKDPDKKDPDKKDPDKTDPDKTVTDPDKKDPDKKDSDKKSSTPSSGSSWAGSIGPEMIGDQTWTKLLLAPKFRFGKLSFQLYLPIYFNSNDPIWKAKKWYNYEEWDFDSFKDAIHDFLLKIMYVQYGDKGDDVFIKLGSNDDFTLGHGFLMDRYSNMVEFPDVRRVGLQVDLRFSSFGFESFVADIYRFKIFGGRLYWMPIKSGIFENAALGFSFITDLKAASVDDNNYVGVFSTSIDLDIPLPSLGLFTWTFFADVAKQGYNVTGTYNYSYGGATGAKTDTGMEFTDGFGLTTGIMGRLLFFKYKLAYRYLKDGFIPEYYNAYYETQRSTLANALMSGAREDFKGWIFEMGADFGRIGFIRLKFQEYYGKIGGVDKTENNLHIILALNKGVIPKFHCSFEYERTDISLSKLFKPFFGENVVTTLKLAYEASEGIDIVTKYRRFYDSTGNFTDNYSVETQIGF